MCRPYEEGERRLKRRVEWEFPQTRLLEGRIPGERGHGKADGDPNGQSCRVLERSDSVRLVWSRAKRVQHALLGAAARGYSQRRDRLVVATGRARGS